ncbi:MAG TPA: histidine phosphatase family protein [Anaerolineae bacterium]
MTIFTLVRHGETNWPTMRLRGIKGRAKNFVELTANGVTQIEALAGDPRLRSAEAILSSPYTRALQSAAILGRCLNLPLHVEYDLHEWVFDRNAGVEFLAEEVERRRLLYYASDRFHPAAEERAWESGFEVRSRAALALQKYEHHAHVIVVCHMGVIFALTGQMQVEPGEIVEYNVKRDT